MVFLRSKVWYTCSHPELRFPATGWDWRGTGLNPVGWWPGPTIGILSAPTDLSLSIGIYLSMSPLCSAIYLSERGLSLGAQKYAWGVSTLEVSYLSSLGWMRGGDGMVRGLQDITYIHTYNNFLIPILIYNCKNPKYSLVCRKHHLLFRFILTLVLRSTKKIQILLIDLHLGETMLFWSK